MSVAEIEKPLTISTPEQLTPTAHHALGELAIDGTAHENIAMLKQGGEIGRSLVPFYKAALTQVPELASVRVLPIPDDKRSRSPGFALHPGISKSGEHEVHIAIGDDWSVFEDEIEKHSVNTRLVAERLGLTFEQMDKETLAAFVLLHELGHSNDYMELDSDAKVIEDRRAADMASLPVPNLHASDLELWAEEHPDKAKAFYQKHKGFFKQQGAKNIQGAIELQQTAYRNLPSESVCDEFAAQVLISLDDFR